MTDLSGQQLDNYQLIRLLGRGSFGEVYLSQNISRNTQVAVKVLQSNLNGQDLYGFLNEARIFRLKHPNIVSILDFGVERKTGLLFLVMDYVAGGTLRQHHPRGTLVPFEKVVHYVKNIAEAVQYAHEENLIHRDIKPENLLVGQHGEILLSDFGIAVLSQSGYLSSQSTQEVVGTPLYMAPEQLLGKPSRASDQYALGIIVYEWLSGESPFKGTFPEIAHQHLQIPPPSIRGKNPVISSEVEQTVMRALEKDPKKRFPTVQAFAIALEKAYKNFYEATTIIEKPKEQWLEEGRVYYSAHRYEEAIKAYSCAIGLDPCYTPGYYRRGIAYYHLGEYWKALADYNHAIELDPKYTSAYYRRGSMYYSLRDYWKAIADFDRVIELNSKYMLAYYNRGLAYAELKEYRKAISDYNHAIKLDSSHVVVYYNRGLAYAELRDYRHAIQDYNRAIEFNPHYSEAHAAREKAYRWLKSR